MSYYNSHAESSSQYQQQQQQPNSYQPPSNSHTQPASRRPDLKRKLVVVGDGGCGKTSLLTVYAENRFPEDYVPTIFENLLTVVPSPLDPSKMVELALWDTAGQEDFDRLRPLSYNDTDVVLIVFAINHRPSLENVMDKWYPELSHFCEGVPLLLIGTKTDLRHDPQTMSILATQGQHPVTPSEGEGVAREMGARRYLECSAKDGRGVREVFDAALREALGKGGLSGVWNKAGKGSKKRKCVIL